MNTTTIRQIRLALAAIGLVVVACSCGVVENKLNAFVDEAAQNFNAAAKEVKTPEDAKNCIAYYRKMEMHFIKFKVKHGLEAPLTRYYAQTSNTLSRIEAEFKLHPDYDSFEGFIKTLAE